MAFAGKKELPLAEDRLVDTIISQYRSAVEYVNLLFSEYPDKCYMENGVGCCGVPLGIADFGIVGPARHALMRMRQERLEKEAKNAGIQPHNACPYHSMDTGCIIEDLKSPNCAASYCISDIPEGYDKDYVFETLQHILMGGFEHSSGRFAPEMNWTAVESICDYSGALLGTKSFRK